MATSLNVPDDKLKDIVRIILAGIDYLEFRHKGTEQELDAEVVVKLTLWCNEVQRNLNPEN